MQPLFGNFVRLQCPGIQTLAYFLNPALLGLRHSPALVFFFFEYLSDPDAGYPHGCPVSGGYSKEFC